MGSGVAERFPQVVSPCNYLIAGCSNSADRYLTLRGCYQGLFKRDIHEPFIRKSHPHSFDFSQDRPIPPLEGEGNSLSLRERGRVRVGIFIYPATISVPIPFFVN